MSSLKSKAALLRAVTLGAAVCALMLGIAARLLQLGKRSLWYDELYCVVGAVSSRTLGELLEAWSNVSGHPPGYMLFLYGWLRLAPATEFWARVPSAAVGVVTLLYLAFGRAGRLTTDARWYAALLYALGYEAIYYAQTSRQYGFFVSCALAALLAATELGDTKPPPHATWLRLLAFSLLAAYVHFVGLLLACALFACALWHARVVNRSLRPPLVYGVVFVLAYVPGLVILAEGVRLRVGGWQANEPLGRLVQLLLERATFGSPLRFRIFAALSGVLALAAHRTDLWNQARALARNRGFRSVGGTFALLAGVFCVLGLVGPFWQLRYALLLYPPLLLLASIVLGQLAPRGSWSAATLTLSILVLGWLDYTDYRTTRKQDWRGSAQHVIAAYASGDEIYVLGDDPSVSARTYLKQRDASGYFYSRHLPFYAYYFGRLGAGALAAQLRPLPLAPTPCRRVLASSAARRLFVLAPHLTQLKPSVLAAARALGFKVAETNFFSTRVYRLSRR